MRATSLSYCCLLYWIERSCGALGLEELILAMNLVCCWAYNARDVLFARIALYCIMLYQEEWLDLELGGEKYGCRPGLSYYIGFTGVLRHGIGGVGMAMNTVVLLCRIVVRATSFFAVPVLDLEG